MHDIFHFHSIGGKFPVHNMLTLPSKKYVIYVNSLMHNHCLYIFVHCLFCKVGQEEQCRSDGNTLKDVSLLNDRYSKKIQSKPERCCLSGGEFLYIALWKFN